MENKPGQSFKKKAIVTVCSIVAGAFFWTNAYAGVFGQNVRKLFPASAYEEKQKEKSPFIFHIGQSQSWPRLTDTNHTIKNLGDQARQYAPGIKQLEDWDDVFTGMSSLGVTYEIPDWPVKDISAFIDFSFGYARGSVETSDRAPSIYGTPADFHHKLTYNTRTAQIQVGGLKEIAEIKGYEIDAGLAGALQLNWLHSSTKLSLVDKVTGFSQTGVASSSDKDFGTSLAAILRVESPGGWILNLQGQYSMAKVEGKARVTETMTNPLLGTNQKSYKMPYTAGFEGPAIYLELGKRF